MSKLITLEAPVKRKGDNNDVHQLTVQKPMAGQLRGTKLVELLQMDVGELITVLPRVTEPALTPDEVARLDPADLLQLGTEVVTFLAGKSKLAELGLS